MNEYFPGQKPDEKVLAFTRPHWLALLPTILVVIVLALLPIGVLIAIPAAGFEFTGSGAAAATVVVSGYYLALATYFFIRWLDYYLDVAIVTDQRIVDIDQNGLFRRTIDELDCKMVQDVAATRTGILQTLFNFGTVEVQTAGERRNFVFESVPRPAEVQKAVASAQGMGEAAEHEDAAVRNAAEAAQQAAEAAKVASQAHAAAERTGQRANPPTEQPPPPQPAPRPPRSDPQDLPREHE